MITHPKAVSLTYDILVEKIGYTPRSELGNIVGNEQLTSYAVVFLSQAEIYHSGVRTDWLPLYRLFLSIATVA